MDVFDALVQAPILPTVMPMAAERLCGFCEALHQEGYSALEVLGRPLDAALTAVAQAMRQPQRAKVNWGIGTLRTRDDARRAVALGPDFVVSPAFSRNVLDVAAEAGIAYIPGVLTFQDVQDVIDAFDERDVPVKVLKLCPVYGLTPEYVMSLRGCFPGINFCPTGEITLDNYIQWKQIPGIAAPMGSELVPHEWITSGDLQRVRARLQLLRSMMEQAAAGLRA